MKNIKTRLIINGVNAGWNLLLNFLFGHVAKLVISIKYFFFLLFTKKIKYFDKPSVSPVLMNNYLGNKEPDAEPAPGTDENGLENPREY